MDTDPYAKITFNVAYMYAVLINYYLYRRVHVLQESNIIVAPGLA